MSDPEMVSRAWRDAIPMFDLIEDDMPLAEMIFISGIGAAFDMLAECIDFDQVTAVVLAAREQALARSLELEDDHA